MASPGSSSSDRLGRALRAFLQVGGAYVAYLLLLGPFWALDGRGFIPPVLHRVVWAPALWLRELPGAEQVQVAYLDAWYLEPQAGETTR